MDELAVRLIVVVGIGGIATISAFAARRGRAWRRRSFECRGLEPGIHLFSSESCASCLRARSVVEAAGISFEEHFYESEAELLEANGIDRVPTVAWVPANGDAGWLAEGIPTGRVLARWMGP